MECIKTPETRVPPRGQAATSAALRRSWTWRWVHNHDLCNPCYIPLFVTVIEPLGQAAGGADKGGGGSGEGDNARH